MKVLRSIVGLGLVWAVTACTHDSISDVSTLDNATLASAAGVSQAELAVPERAVGGRILRHGGDGALSLAPATLGQSLDSGCAGGGQVTIEGVPGRRALVASDLTKMRGRISLVDGRDRHVVGVSLATLLRGANGDVVEITSCDNAKASWTMKEILHRSDRFVVTVSSHSSIKVLERAPSGVRVASADFPVGVDVITRARHVVSIRVSKSVPLL
jgi:hypothetical protein